MSHINDYSLIYACVDESYRWELTIDIGGIRRKNQQTDCFPRGGGWGETQRIVPSAGPIKNETAIKS